MRCSSNVSVPSKLRCAYIKAHHSFLNSLPALLTEMKQERNCMIIWRMSLTNRWLDPRLVLHGFHLIASALSINYTGTVMIRLFLSPWPEPLHQPVHHHGNWWVYVLLHRLDGDIHIVGSRSVSKGEWGELSQGGSVLLTVCRWVLISVSYTGGSLQSQLG